VHFAPLTNDNRVNGTYARPRAPSMPPLTFPTRKTAAMTWVEVLAAFLVAHLVGDYLLQTDWQARHKAGGLGGDRTALKALAAHVATYTLAFVPACVWIGGERGAGWAVLAGALVALPHLVIDDARVVRLYLREVKGAEGFEPGLAAAVDQAFHVVSLCVVALLVGVA
jgi:hypothetical protein